MARAIAFEIAPELTPVNTIPAGTGNLEVGGCHETPPTARGWMGGEFRQRIPEVKGTGVSGSTGGWMAKTRLWMAGTLAAAAVAGIGLWFAGNPISPAEKLAKPAARAQNLIIFDAAVDLLKANYYDHALFHKPGWKEYETEWREKAATSQGGEF
jgi:hypothetical protein